MKKNIYILFAVLMSVSCRAYKDAGLLCSREFICDMAGTGSISTKTSLGPGNAIIWDNDDRIKVFPENDATGTVFSDVTLENEGRRAVFKGVTEIADTYYAIYPAGADATYNPEGKTITMNIPSEQYAVPGSFADNTNPSVARSDGNNLYFRNIGALLAIKCPTAYASSIRLQSSDKELAISGKAEVSLEGDIPETAEIKNGSSHIDLTGLDSSSYGKTFYLIAYPGDYKGFNIIITNSSKTHRSIISSPKGLKLERNDNFLLFDGPFAGWNAPMEPSVVNADLESDFSLTVSWKCSSDESICKGFRIFARQTGSTEFPMVLGETESGIRSMNTRDLTEGLSYDIGVQSLGYEQKYDSEIIWVHNVKVPESGLYEWEKSREGILQFADLDLLAGGLTSKTPNKWDENRLKPHVTFTDENGNEQWLHEAFLFIGNEDTQSGSTFSITSEYIKSGDQASWQRFADYWISDKGVAKVLDQTISNAISRIGHPSFRHKVVIAMPDPIMLEYFADKTSSKTYWGKVEGRQLDFSSTSDQVLAYQWFIDYVRAAWDKVAPQNLELAGFYILSEELVAVSSGWNYKYKRWDKILPDVSEYLHARKYGMFWIPYYKASGYNMTSTLGIDYTWLQPNKYWDYSEKKSWTWVFDTMSTYGHGMEIEFEGSHGEPGWSQYEEGTARTSSSILETVRTDQDAQGTPKGQPNPQAARNKQLLRDYMARYKESGHYGKTRIATYSGTDGMYELATSTDAADKEMYLEYCRFIAGNPMRK